MPSPHQGITLFILKELEDNCYCDCSGIFFGMIHMELEELGDIAKTL